MDKDVLEEKKIIYCKDKSSINKIKLKKIVININKNWFN
jgi:hypothetical protein